MLSTSSLASALEAVAALDRDLTDALGQADVLAAHTYSAARTLWELRRSIERSMINARGLREELLGVAGDESEHYQAVALRERTAVIVVRLAELARAEYETEGNARELYAGRFARLVDVSTHLLEQIGRVNEACFRSRLESASWRSPELGVRGNEHAAYREALACAADQLALIGRDPDLLRFLRVGAGVASEPFRLGCRAIASVLNVPLDARSPP